MARNPRGFTLVEALFSLVIILMVMGALTQTLKQAAEVKKNTKNMDQSIEEFHALFTMKSDVLASISLTAPSAGSTDSKIELSLVNPNLTFLERIDSLGDPLDPFENSEQLSVEYRLDQGYLKRFVTAPSLPTTAERLLKTETFETHRTNTDPGLLTITLQLKGTRVTKTRAIKVALKPI